MPYIYTNPYKSTYFAAKQELEQRRAELDFVTRRIAQLEESIRTLEPLAEDDSAAPATAGISELCAEILRRLPTVPMSANDVMQALKFRGFDVSGYSNPLAVLHTTLTRLCKPHSGFVKGKNPLGEPMYAYNPTMNAPMGNTLVSTAAPWFERLPPPPPTHSNPDFDIMEAMMKVNKKK